MKAFSGPTSAISAVWLRSFLAFMILTMAASILLRASQGHTTADHKQAPGTQAAFTQLNTAFTSLSDLQARSKCPVG